MTTDLRVMTYKNSNPIECYFWFFLLVHLVAWTVAPILVRHNLPLDAMEGTVWGHQLEWGYDKNPYLNAWLTAAAVYVGGNSGWMIYLFSQIAVISCFWAIWQLGQQFFSKWIALIAVLLLESMQYYNFHAIDFNDNTLEISLWALSSYFFYLALQKPRHYFPWLATGFFIGLGVMAKYYTLCLLTAMLLLILRDQKERRLLLTLPPYLGIGVVIIIGLPHVIWLFSHDFITIRYVFERTNSIPHWTNHFVYPFQFAYQQLLVFLPALCIYLGLFLGKKPRFQPQQASLSTLDKRFLYYIGLGPLILTLLLSFISGIKLHTGWGSPLLSFMPLLLFSYSKPHLSLTKIHFLMMGIYLLLAVFLISYTVSIKYSINKSSANFPGRALSRAVTDYWHTTYHTPLNYIAGARWIAGNIAFYSADHPTVFIAWDKKRSPWINIQDMEKKGAVFVWDLNKDKETLPKKIRNTYPQLSPVSIWTFAWLNNNTGEKPVKIGIAFLPPAKTT